MSVLPDILASGLDVVFCGSAAGTASARAGQYYAGRGNKFWPILRRIGLTPIQLAPAEFARVLEFAIGLTDLNKVEFGADSSLTRRAYDVDGLRGKIQKYRPRVLAFNGLKPSRAFLGRNTTGYGLQAGTFEGAAIFVLPSTSGSACGSWNEQHWHDLAAFVSATNRGGRA